MTQLHQNSRGSYGIRRLQSDLKDAPCFHGKTRLSRLMKLAGLKAANQPRYKVTTNSRHNHGIAPNLLDRDFNPIATNIAWIPDITYIKTDEGWLYLATVLDLFSRKIIGWSLSPRLKTPLIIDALNMAVK
ncbi:DDE-type integrase/transposase/recombinase [Limnobaculum parvum]|uniref:Integrase catalytic domain-containing protein n=1 Tax=Limnobaculum parvum TaxID=2172103 RepID=A0A2Y9U1P4_9GAMM|nr:DDE-type integrase/transposase/recombinase [Limnobaculum parvum]AWH89875.1 hypothetical protein HYN51_15840 [Limnobaculum parvum]